MSLRIQAIFLVFLAGLGLWSGCGQDADLADPTDPLAIPAAAPDLALLALGDSYTVGQGLPARWSWPLQLADSLAVTGDSLRTVDIIAQTGWTTRDLLAALRDRLAHGPLSAAPYDLVTLMIGVNNQFQGLDPVLFAADLDTLIAMSIELAGHDPARVLGFSIPDYGVTPVGEMFGSARIAVEIESHNVILRDKFDERGIVLLDITTLSRLAEDEPDLVARDGLHYSQEMYARWVTLMLPAVRTCLMLP